MDNDNKDNLEPTQSESQIIKRYYYGNIPSTPEELEKIPKLPRKLHRLNLPETVDLSANFPPAGDQGEIGSCTAWAVAYAAKTYMEQSERKWGVNTPDHQFSPSFLYNQRNNKFEEKSAKVGMSFAKAFGIAENQGICTLADMPYNKDNYSFAAPNDAQRKAALKYKCAKPFLVPDNDILVIKDQLSNGNPVLISLRTYDQFENLNEKNYIYNSTKGSSGSHALCLVGYDDKIKAFKFINSWGTGWGIKGYAYVTYDFIKKKTAEIQTFVFNSKIIVQGLTLNHNQIELPIGESQTLTTTIHPPDASIKTIKFSSEDTSIVSVSETEPGKIVATGIGQTNVLVESNDPDCNASAVCKVNVKHAVISLDMSSMILYVGEAKALKSKIEPYNSKTSKVTWKSSNSSVASVSGGTVRAKAPGEAIITVKCNYANSIASASCHVKVKPNDDSIIISDTIPEKMVAGKTYHVTVTIKNTGNITWRAQAGNIYSPYYLRTNANNNNNGALFLNGSESVGMPIGTKIAPEQVFVLSFNMKAPAQTGTYKLNFKMSKQQYTWFGDTLERIITVIAPGEQSEFNTYGSVGTFGHKQIKENTHIELKRKKLKNQHLELYNFNYTRMQPYTHNKLREGEL